MASKEAQFNTILGDPIIKKKYVGAHHHNKAVWYTSKSIPLLLTKKWRKGIKEHKNKIPHSLFLKPLIHRCIWNPFSSSQTAERTAPFFSVVYIFHQGVQCGFQRWKHIYWPETNLYHICFIVFNLWVYKQRQKPEISHFNEISDICIRRAVQKFFERYFCIFFMMTMAYTVMLFSLKISRKSSSYLKVMARPQGRFDFLMNQRLI